MVEHPADINVGSAWRLDFDLRFRGAQRDSKRAEGLFRKLIPERLKNALTLPFHVLNGFQKSVAFCFGSRRKLIFQLTANPLLISPEHVRKAPPPSGKFRGEPFLECFLER